MFNPIQNMVEGYCQEKCGSLDKCPNLFTQEHIRIVIYNINKCKQKKNEANGSEEIPEAQRP